MSADLQTVRITAIAAGGEGVGRLADGRAVFVPRAAPGDHLELADLRLHRRFARARIGRLLEPGPGRVTPRCVHYERDQCGGCQLQHLELPVQHAAKRQIVGDALRRLGRLEVADPPLEPAPAAWGYRSKLTLAVGQEGKAIGLHRLGESDVVFDLDRCEIAAPRLQELWQAVRRCRPLLPAGLVQVILRLDGAGGEHLILRARGKAPRPRADSLGAGLRDQGRNPTIWYHPLDGPPQVAFGDPRAFPAVVFEQINPGLADRIRSFALDHLEPLAGRSVWDLYAGIGETTDALVARGAWVESVEVDARAVAVAERRGNAAVRHVGCAEDLVERLRPPDRVVANPPRAGMDERVIAALVRRPPERLAYLSCDPATLARDAARLQSRYRPTVVRAFDLFPQTSHVETVLILEAT